MAARKPAQLITVLLAVGYCCGLAVDLCALQLGTCTTAYETAKSAAPEDTCPAYRALKTCTDALVKAGTCSTTTVIAEDRMVKARASNLLCSGFYSPKVSSVFIFVSIALTAVIAA